MEQTDNYDRINPDTGYPYPDAQALLRQDIERCTQRLANEHASTLAPYKHDVMIDNPPNYANLSSQSLTIEFPEQTGTVYVLPVEKIDECLAQRTQDILAENAKLAEKLAVMTWRWRVSENKNSIYHEHLINYDKDVPIQTCAIDDCTAVATVHNMNIEDLYEECTAMLVCVTCGKYICDKHSQIDKSNLSTCEGLCEGCVI